MNGRRKSQPAKSENASLQKLDAPEEEVGPAPELVELVQAMARAAARRDIRRELEAVRKKLAQGPQPELPFDDASA